jgi:hypothetical protein
MYKEVLRSIDGVGIYPVMSFVIFGLFFIGMSVYVFAMKKTKVDDLKQIPLND